MRARGITLPLEGQSATDPATRLRDGLAVQKSIFGDGIDIPTRELLTFAILLSLGGAEPQVRAHFQGNLNVGATKATLLVVITQLIPFIGYPRALNDISPEPDTET